MASKDKTQHKLTIGIDPTTTPLSSSATDAGERFFVIRANYAHLSTSTHQSPPPATWLTRLVVEPRSDFLCDRLRFVGHIYGGMGVSLPDEVLRSFVPVLSRFSRKLAADPIAATQKVVRIQLDLTALNSSPSDANVDRAMAEPIAINPQ